jgi:hypothetical protein
LAFFDPRNRVRLLPANVRDLGPEENCVVILDWQAQF